MNSFQDAESNRSGACPPQRRRWLYPFQFSIRWMLVAVAVLAIVMSVQRQRRLAQEEVETLLSRGWELHQVPDGIRLMGNLREKDDPDSWRTSLSQVATVAEWEGAVEISIHGELVGPLTELRALPQLKRLRLGACKVGQAEIREISQLPNLEALALANVGADDLEPLQDSKRLAYLRLFDPSPDALRSLPKILHLRWLTLRQSRPSQNRRMIQQLHYVAKCPQLEVLDISYVSIGSDLTALIHAPNLRMIRIENHTGHPSLADPLARIRSLRTCCIRIFDHSFGGDAQFRSELLKHRPDIQLLPPSDYLPGDPFKW
jgi:hypothetical protein